MAKGYADMSVEELQKALGQLDTKAKAIREEKLEVRKYIDEKIDEEQKAARTGGTDSQVAAPAPVSLKGRQN